MFFGNSRGNCLHFTLVTTHFLTITETRDIEEPPT
jgi:hypothetical protein